MKLGRNDACWCGSAKKYKRCHLGRDKAEPLTREEILGAWKKAYGRKYCLHPLASRENCDGNIVKSHTIQRNGGLSKIAQDGHVYNCLLHGKSRFASIEASMKPDRVGVKQASIFTGFCGHHDDLLFAPLEKQPFQGTQEQVFLLGYRVLCQELFLKKATVELAPIFHQFDNGRSSQQQYSIQDEVSAFIDGASKAKNELEPMKALQDEMLLKANFLPVNYYLIFFAEAPNILCSGVTQPEIDFEGNRLQNLGDRSKQMEWLHFSLIANDTGGVAVFSWLQGNSIPEKSIDTLHSLANHAVPHAIVRFAFEYFENTYFSIPWWHNLDPATRAKLMARQLRVIDHPGQCLMDDGVRPVDWTVDSRLRMVG